MTMAELLNRMLGNMFRTPRDLLYFASEKQGAIMAVQRAKEVKI